MLKFQILIAIFLLLLFPSVIAEPSIIISDYELEPSVLLPGDNATLTLTIYNAETAATRTSTSISGSTTTTTVQTSAATIDKIWITEVGDGTYSINPSSSYSDIGALAAGASMSIIFKLQAHENISQGLYFPKVRVNLESASHEDVSYPIPVKISNSSIDLIAKEVPTKISIGGSTAITLEAVNNRENTVDGVTINPVDTDFVDFMPKSIFIDTIESDSSEEISFSVNPNKTGIVNLSFILSYKNGDNYHQKTVNLKSEIIETLDVAPVLYNNKNSFGKGDTGKLRLEVYNAKKNEITGVIVTPILEDEDVEISPSQYFIGSMDPDDVFSASFDVSTDNLNIGNKYNLSFMVTYKQNDNFFETPSVSASFTVTEPTNENEGGSTCYTSIAILLIVIIVIVLFFIIRKRRKAR